jgi:hypothetical protein
VKYPADALIAPEMADHLATSKQELPMDWMLAITFDTIVMSAITCLIVREAMIIALPDRLAGPGGSFIDTAKR